MLQLSMTQSVRLKSEFAADYGIHFCGFLGLLRLKVLTWVSCRTLTAVCWMKVLCLLDPYASIQPDPFTLTVVLHPKQLNVFPIEWSQRSFVVRDEDVELSGGWTKQAWSSAGDKISFCWERPYAGAVLLARRKIMWWLIASVKWNHWHQ